jgi:hypothetical protein
MLLNGGNCSQSYGVQKYMPDKYSCTDVARGGVPTTKGAAVYVVVTALKDPSIVYTSQYVAVGDTFPVNHNGQPFAADQNITIYSSNQIGPDTMLQTTHYQSSCSQNLYLLDRFGAVQILAWTNGAQGVVSVYANATVTVQVTVPSDIAGSSLSFSSFYAVTNFGVFNFTDNVAGRSLVPGASVQVSFDITLDMTQPRRYTILVEIVGVTNTGKGCQGSAFYNFNAGVESPSFPSISPVLGSSNGVKKLPPNKKGKVIPVKVPPPGKLPPGKMPLPGIVPPPGKDPPLFKTGPPSPGFLPPIPSATGKDNGATQHHRS